MPESTTNQVKRRSRLSSLLAVILTALPVALAVILYRLEPFDPAPLPLHELAGAALSAPLLNGRMLRGAEPVGRGALAAPEDLVFDAEAGLIYTGCADGWVKRVTVNDSVVEDWVNTGGRPLGLVLGRDGKLFVADADKGLLSVSKEGTIEVLSDQSEGLKFKLTDGVDESEDGTLYFTDATHKYNMRDHIFDILEGKPHGRLLSYDPLTKQTTTLLRGLYYPNGVVVSPDQASLVYCETVMQRCRKYHLKGEKKGSVEPFAEKLPGIPDNIRYDAERGLYWIALPTEVTPSVELAMKYPLVRKLIAILEKYGLRPITEQNGGVFAVDIEGKPVYHFHDAALSSISSGIRIGNHLYCGSVTAPYILRLNLKDYPARPHT